MSIEVNQIKIEFNVTPDIKRYVYMYVIVGVHCYLIDSGVAGSEAEVEKYLNSIGRKMTDIKAVFLIHAHPDHIGSAARIKEKSGCKVYAGEGEAPWIEDIDKQYAMRPIPNFYALAGQSVRLDGILHDGDIVLPEPGLTLEVMGTPGHSCDGLSYILKEKQCIFTGDAIPVMGDIPILVNIKDSEDSLKRLAGMSGSINRVYPAWDRVYEKEQIAYKINEASKLIATIKESVNKAKQQSGDLDEITDIVCQDMNTPEFKKNPLFRRTIEAFYIHFT